MNEIQKTALVAHDEVTVTRYAIRVPAAFHFPYEGKQSAVHADFPNGFIPSFGSGLAFKALLPNGDLELYGLTDRGPNADGPALDDMESKIFPAPSFTPSIGIFTASQNEVRVHASVPIRMASGAPASGLPLPAGSLGNSAEIPLFDTMQFDPSSKAIFSANGIDSEAIAFDRVRNQLWVTDEYGPFLLKIDPASGVIQKRYGPGTGLPMLLSKRRANRGMEGMTFDEGSGIIHAFLQSPLTDGNALSKVTGESERIERFAAFTRWIAFDPGLEATTAMFAYPLDGADYADGRTGNAKLGDLVALGDGRFIVIEQGAGPDGTVFNKLMLVTTGGASNLLAPQFNPETSDLEKSSMGGAPENGADWSKVVPLTKSVLLDLNALGWRAEKAEGLALVDDCTLAMTNDNDFGLAPKAEGDFIRVTRGTDHERPLRLWLLKFHKSLSSY